MYACSSPSGTGEPYSADTGELWLGVYTGWCQDSGHPFPGVVIPGFHHSKCLRPLTPTLSLTLSLAVCRPWLKAGNSDPVPVSERWIRHQQVAGSTLPHCHTVYCPYARTPLPQSGIVGARKVTAGLSKWILQPISLYMYDYWLL